MKSSPPQGSLRVWVDIMTLDEATYFPVVDITPTPPVDYEVRAVVWKTRNIDFTSPDDLTNMSDLFISATLQDGGAVDERRNTDIHWRCSNGRGSFNWRMK